MNHYESEAKLEEKLINQLCEQGYHYIEINDVKALEKNFRNQMNQHNQVVLKGKPLSDTEFEKLMIRLSGKSVFTTAKELRQQQHIIRDDGTLVYLELWNKNEWEKNYFQVTEQTTITGKYQNRYDVTILINGLPLVQIELKRRGIDMKEAFDQIKRYKNHSYNGLYRFIQLFVISNGVDTKYFANNDQELNYHLAFYWTDTKNKRMTNLEQFCIHFLDPFHLSKMISKYMILNETDKLLLIMRPYQVYAVESIIDRALNTNNNGYIWHTTGSGKTITSFKTSQILASNPSIQQVFFLVDRKDLDKQTLDEFNKFDPGSVDMTNETSKLLEQIKDSSKPLIITTIQKMSKACSNPKYQKIMEKYKDQKTIFIIDECHRSQFGQMHKNILNTFTNAQYFGFTGTPRFEENKSADGRTTADLFGKCLHTYLIKDAIKDGNVLGFSVDYIKTIHYTEGEEEWVEGIDKSEALLKQDRIDQIAHHIITHHDQKTRNRKYNALFAVSSIPMLMKYYEAFKNISHDLKIGAIFTQEINEESKENEYSQDALNCCIQDYNQMFHTNFALTTADAYFKDVCKKIKNAEIDIVIVVGMLLTGFDAKKLNTLYVDKSLKYHDLIQSFSRTNRVETDTKPHGNIICYRTTKEATDTAVKLFSKTDNVDVVIMKPYAEYLKDYKEKVNQLLYIAPSVEHIQLLEENGDEKKLKEFIIAFREIAKVLVSLNTFLEFNQDQETCFSKQQFQDYKSKYYEIYRKVSTSKEKSSILSDVGFSIELIQTDKINVSYILNLIRDIDLTDKKQTQKEIKEIENKLVNITDDELFLKVDLIKKFLHEVIPSLQPDDSIDDAFHTCMNQERQKEIEIFAQQNDIDLKLLQSVIEEVEYSGIFPNEMLGQAIHVPFLKKIALIDQVKQFIEKILKKYL